MPRQTLSADGSTAWFSASGPDRVNQHMLRAHGDFGGGTLTVETRLNGVAAADGVTDPDISWTTDNARLILLGENDELRFTLTGSTDPDLLVSMNG
jgi:hypothetical protein